MGARSIGIAILAAALDQNMSLQCVFAREALVAVSTRKGLHSQMDSLMSLKVMVAVEALRALVAFEWTIWGGRRHAMRWHMATV
jgi:hypothetical protein